MSLGNESAMDAADALDAMDTVDALDAITAAGNACWKPIRMMTRPDCESRRDMQSRWLTVIELFCLNSTTGRCHSTNYLPSHRTDELSSCQWSNAVQSKSRPGLSGPPMRGAVVGRRLPYQGSTSAERCGLGGFSLGACHQQPCVQVLAADSPGLGAHGTLGAC
jgi:hypothetical protein